MLSLFYYIMEDFDITKQRSLLNWAQIIGLCAFLIAVTWTVSKIHSRFEIMESEHTSFELQIQKDRAQDQKRIEYVDERINKKFNQLKDTYHSK